MNALTPTYSNLQPACVVRSPQIGYGGRARPDHHHHKRCQPFFDLITGRMPQSGKLPVLNLLTCQKSGFSPSRCDCDSLHRLTSNLARPTDTRVALFLYNFTPIGAGDGNAAPKYRKFPLLENSRLAGVNPLTDFEYFRFFCRTAYPTLTFQI